MRKLISFVHVSLDGFVAGPNGEMDWIKVNQDIFDRVEKRIAETDTALYGRVTYELMESYWPTAANKPDASKHDIEHSKWYRNARKIVLSKTLQSDGSKNMKVINDNLSDEINKIKQQDGEEIPVFGSPRATHSLIERGLIDGYWLFLNPAILGNGIPLFAGVSGKINLKLISNHKFDCGVTELNYIAEG